MVKFENPNGYIEITNNYFASLVGQAAQSCFGVTGMVEKNPVQSIKSFIKPKKENENLSRGVFVRSINGSLNVDLHISVSYGVNISAITDSIKNKVSYTVETATGLTVSKVNVFIAGIN